MPRHVLSTLLAVLLARSLAVHAGLAMPQVAMACVFIVMQPRIELVLAKSLYRLAGTLAGALAVTVLAGRFAATPAGFLLALGCWVCFCTALATFSTQYRAYGIVLAGYTAVIVGIPVAFEPQQAGVEALMRLKEVGLGIACAALLAIAGNLAWPSLPRGAARVADAVPGRGARPRPIPAAVIAALFPASAILLIGSLWVGTGWTGGAVAALNTTVNCALVALAPAPFAAAKLMARGTLLALVAAVLVHAAGPVLGDDLAFYLVLLPALAAGARWTARPETTGLGLGYGITLCMLGVPAGLAPGALSTHQDAAAGMLLSIVALLAICAAACRLAARARREPCSDR
jgi:uncharacterized membrane protein YccC